ncbi:glycosyltransferase family 4 protein [Pontiella sp.]|uniref:glycosyltransferase family 4 protein n=1 Tax=Pontiella sp. TaxID=2837462 RepID=UPI0035660773
MRRYVPDKWGGTESVVANLSRGLQRRAIGSTVFCTDMFSETGRQEIDGVEVRRFSYVFPWLGLSQDAKARLRLKGGSPLSLPLFLALLGDRELSLIHTHVQHRLGGMARTAARLKGIPYIVSLHGGYFTLPREQAEKMAEPFRGKPEWGKIFGAVFGSRRVLADADAIICVGQAEADEVRKRYPGKDVLYLPNGVDIDRFAAAEASLFRAAHGWAPSDKLVLCVSRIDYQKNQLGLVRAFAAFAERHPDHRLALIGAVTVAAYRKQIDAEIERLGLAGKVVMIEGLRPDDPLLPSAYRAAEMFVLPSVNEPFGIVVLEAWAAGVPVVASRVGGVPGFTADRRNVLHVEPGNEAQLAGRMAELADNAGLREELARNAAAAVSRYAWDSITAEYLRVYVNLVNKRSACDVG